MSYSCSRRRCIRAVKICGTVVVAVLTMRVWSRKGRFRPPKLTFRRFACLLLALAFLALSPIILFHASLNREKIKDCEWIHNPPMVCAHGGDSSKAPPNTLAAYNLALTVGVDCIEIDASRTQDGILVALHDRELQAMAKASGLHVGDLTIEQIQLLDAGLGFSNEFRNQKVPTIENALRYVSRSVKQVIVDVKVGPPRFAQNLAADVKYVVERTLCKNCVVWSKVDRVVHSYKQLSREEAMAGYIVMNDTSNEEMMNPLRIMSAEVVGAYHGLVSNEFVSTVHGAGKKLHVWTVDEEEDMEQMLYRGVDCVITSQPRVLQQVMNRISTQCMQEGKFI